MQQGKSLHLICAAYKLTVERLWAYHASLHCEQQQTRLGVSADPSARVHHGLRQAVPGWCPGHCLRRSE